MSEGNVPLVYQTNKKTGVVYVYENHPYWSKEKRQSRAKRKCIGKLDAKTGKIIPTRGSSPKKVTPPCDTTIKNDAIEQVPFFP